MTTKEDFLNKKKNYLTNIFKLYNKENNYDKDILDVLANNEICRKCKGYCCTFSPKYFSTNDFLNISDLEYMKELLDTGLISIYLDEDKWILRPRGILDKDSIISYNPCYNSCCFYDFDKGCRLQAEYRPSECLLYFNLKNESSNPPYEKHINLYKEKASDEYEVYQSELQKLYIDYYNKKIPLNVSDDNINSLVRKITKQ